MQLVPRSRPVMSKNLMDILLSNHGVTDKLLVVGVRGFFSHETGSNQRGIYDDAIFLVSDTAFAGFNGNTDPSSFRKGSGKGANKGMADLKPGLYHAHQLGLHRGKYMALIQTGGPVTVIRDGNPPYEDTGMFGINIHHGSLFGTSSLGCQTIHPDQWNGFIGLVESEMKHHGIKTMPYLLVEA